MSKDKNEDTPPKYTVRKVTDFLNIPEDRLDDCLAEFKDYLEMVRGITAYAALVGKVIDAGNPDAPLVESTGFTWVDDGKLERHIRIQTKMGEKPVTGVHGVDFI